MTSSPPTDAVGRTPAPPLSGERVRLHPVAEGDLPALLEILSEPEVAEWWGRYDEQRLRSDLAVPELEGWTIFLGETVLGLIQATEEPEPDYRYASIDLFVTPAHHGEGLGADAVRAVLRHLFARGHHRVTIDPAMANERAIRSYTGVGFQPVGVMRQAERASDGTWRDVLLMEMLAGELRC